MPGYPIELPRDEGSHPQFRTEWWYLTGWLETRERRAARLPDHVLPHRDPASTKTIRRVSPRGRCCSRTRRSATRSAARCCAMRSRRARASVWPSRRKARSTCKIDDWSLRKEGERYRAVAATSEFALRAGMRRHAAAAAARQERLQSEESAAAVRELLLQPAAAADAAAASRSAVASIACAVWRGSIMNGRARMFDERARGWDWIGLNLDDGGALMVQRMRDEPGGKHWGGATLRAARPAGPRRYAAGRDRRGRRCVTGARRARASAIRSNGKSQSASAR